MTRASVFAVFMTAFQLIWSAGWGFMHVRIRKGRRYAEGRTKTRTDSLYKRANPLLFVVANKTHRLVPWVYEQTS